MTLESHLAPGDMAWICNGKEVRLVTIGQVRITLTDSKGINGGVVEPYSRIAFDNYKPQKEFTEEYMCDETGIGSGSIWTFGKNIFQTKQDAETALSATQSGKGEV